MVKLPSSQATGSAAAGSPRSRCASKLGAWHPQRPSQWPAPSEQRLALQQAGTDELAGQTTVVVLRLLVQGYLQCAAAVLSAQACPK